MPYLELCLFEERLRSDTSLPALTLCTGLNQQCCWLTGVMSEPRKHHKIKLKVI